MTDEKWTPGPWVSTGYLVKSVDGDDVVYSCSKPGFANANSALIAAAPEMYDLLIESSVYLSDKKLLESIESILRKARGDDG